MTAISTDISDQRFTRLRLAGFRLPNYLALHGWFPFQVWKATGDSESLMHIRKYKSPSRVVEWFEDRQNGFQCLDLCLYA
jgi:hypothetical protein